MKQKKIKKYEGENLDESNKKILDEKAEARKSSSENLAEEIKIASQGLFYISETDAEISPFVGMTAEKVDQDEIIKQTKMAADTNIKEKSFSGFFARLTEIQDWFGDEEKETAQKFTVLKQVLENNIRELKVFKVGKIELDIYVVGLDSENTFLGIKTKAVETGD